MLVNRFAKAPWALMSKTKPGTTLILASLVDRAAARTERHRPYLAAGRGAASKADCDVNIHARDSNSKGSEGAPRVGS